MRLTDQQLEQFDRDGILVLPAVFSPTEVAAFRDAFDAVCAEDVPANIREKKSGAVRTAMGLHLRHPTFAGLVRDPRLVQPARQILATDRLYVQQVKVNVKAAFEGEAWQWHYDFATHHREDGVPEPLALNLHVFLDDVTEFNGPLHFVTGSHRHGAQPTFLDTETTSYDLWCVDREVVGGLVREGRLVAGTGVAGSMLIFGDLLVHSSPPNMSPFDRRIFSLILNPVSNAYTRDNRPDYKHHRDLTPVETV
ncbi:MAG: phytanoyl-CoA dioxygenase family protein [Ectothiorhodospiraceae bacterium]|nr:phytanoyl-CoA dioxygenase family protein [Chromatiales bacterium]MCP5154129.1 phytanoyl-CoA dioxygenase family protein [Ectothiorhodospiraceae bacterium]